MITKKHNPSIKITSAKMAMPEKKIKVIWLCYFTNQRVQKFLKPLKRVNEIAPWITNMIPLFENDHQIELHIVSQHEWISGYKKFVDNGITFHFFNRGMPLIGRHWPGFFKFDHHTNFYHWKKNVDQVVNNVQPNIIHLHGAENEFCTAISQFRNRYPVFITIQGFIHKSTTAQSKTAQSRCEKEIEIIQSFKHFGYRTETMGKDIKALNSDAVLHWHTYPNNMVITPFNAAKKFDIVFFARMSKDKGIEDLLKAVAILKDKDPTISLCAIGGGKTENLKKQAKVLGIEANVFWAGFLPTHNDVHQLASAAKISVLPTYHDIVSGTIIESLFLGLPVVAYDVGSIHEVNSHGNIISLVPKGDIETLAMEIMKLLDNEKLRMEKSDLGRKAALKMFDTDDNEVREDILKAYKSVIKDFHSHRPSTK